MLEDGKARNSRRGFREDLKEGLDIKNRKRRGLSLPRRRGPVPQEQGPGLGGDKSLN